MLRIVPYHLSQAELMNETRRAEMVQNVQKFGLYVIEWSCFIHWCKVTYFEWARRQFTKKYPLSCNVSTWRLQTDILPFIRGFVLVIPHSFCVESWEMSFWVFVCSGLSRPALRHASLAELQSMFGEICTIYRLKTAHPLIYNGQEGHLFRKGPATLVEEVWGCFMCLFVQF